MTTTFERDWRIGDMYGEGDITRKELAERFGVSVSTVNRALAGLDWKEIIKERQKIEDDHIRDLQMHGGGL